MIERERLQGVQGKLEQVVEILELPAKHELDRPFRKCYVYEGTKYYKCVMNRLHIYNIYIS